MHQGLLLMLSFNVIAVDEILSDAFILKLMKNVTFDEAEKLAIYLRVKTQGFERTDPSLFAVNIVKWWKENCAKKPTEACRELASALKDAELASLSMKILKKLPQEEAGNKNSTCHYIFSLTLHAA